jgi:phage terminase large subunit
MIGFGIKKKFDEIFADSAEPKSIEEIYRYGFNIKGAGKGQGSVEFGHQLIRQYKQFWTKDSLNGIKEQRNYRYVQDKNNKLTDKTTHNFSHLMDARRYAVVGKLSPVEREEIVIFDAMSEFGLNRI